MLYVILNVRLPPLPLLLPLPPLPLLPLPLLPLPLPPPLLPLPFSFAAAAIAVDSVATVLGRAWI
jgi:hypothetical protein